ncbi:MAG: hypothetical protein AAF497_17140 [Planctomycetota bacterium]
MKHVVRRKAIAAAAAIGTAASIAPCEASADDAADKELESLLRWQPKGPGQKWDAPESLWLRQLVVELKAIKTGVMRAELEQQLVSDGPTRSRKAHRYQHSRCPFIKLDVFFDVADTDAHSAASPTDKAVRIEGPRIDLSSNYQRW